MSAQAQRPCDRLLPVGGNRERQVVADGRENAAARSRARASEIPRSTESAEAAGRERHQQAG